MRNPVSAFFDLLKSAFPETRERFAAAEKDLADHITAEIESAVAPLRDEIAALRAEIGGTAPTPPAAA
ncbi:hypothetical protein FV232_01005 [Methylobacterium sp. WL30]|uniref:hypothetical protein n=1 Tax=unclassified Methylobacterium TaxID=2615210 RepID=UPI0011CB5752|nr:MULTISPECIES: hypothetical protein [unclassified Methylobacterium]TXN38966.1 hypothetical protein FV225_11595 [Methylobacterium sp. WL93]TXN52253.1 hypothetical protein FV227_04165 [Methylobacterium sp. WL119]TXN70664.1 hypothetical protein FV232_01005 [Methylobacterium sp. WL30]